MMTVKREVVETDVYVEVYGVAIPTLDEAMELPERLRVYSNWWWTRTAIDALSVAAIDRDGDPVTNGVIVDDDGVAVRPLLLIDTEHSDVKCGDVFMFSGCEFEVITDHLAFCRESIGCSEFNYYYDRPDSCEFNGSDLMKYITEWFNAAYADVEDEETEEALSPDAYASRKLLEKHCENCDDESCVYDPKRCVYSIAIDALGKQMAMAPVWSEAQKQWVCPHCDEPIILVNAPFCPQCGQCITPVGSICSEELKQCRTPNM